MNVPAGELIVVDNTPGQPEVEAIAETHGARYVTEPRPGLSRARNRGALTATRDFVAFIDDDAVAQPDWLENLLRGFQDASVAATTGRVVPDGPSTGLEPLRWATVAREDLGPEARRLKKTSPDWFEKAGFGGIGLAGNMAIRRAVFERGHRFREDIGLPFPVLGEEHYLFLNLVDGGHTIEYMPAAIIWHSAVQDERGLQQRKLRLLRGSAAFLILLIVEEPAYRRRAVRFGLETVARRRRPWRWAQGSAPLTSWLEVMRAAVAAPWLYLGWRRAALREPSARGYASTNGGPGPVRIRVASQTPAMTTPQAFSSALAGKLPPRYGEDFLSPLRDRALASMPANPLVMDFGAGRRPTLPIALRPPGSTYIGVDISRAELQRAGAGAYDDIVVTDVTVSRDELEGRFDTIVSWNVLEHVESLPATLSALRLCLRPGGMLFAQFASRHSPHAIVNRLVPEAVAERGMELLLDRPPHTVFEARYDHCDLPALQRLASGFSRAEVLAQYRDAVYLEFSRIAQGLFLIYEEWAFRQGKAQLASHFLLCARR